MSWGLISCKLRVKYLPYVSMALIIDLRKHTQLASKHGENAVKPKMGILIFLNTIFLNHIELTAMITFLQGSIYF